MEGQIDLKLKEALVLLAQGEPAEAQKILEFLFESDLENKEVAFSNSCCVYLDNTFSRILKNENPYELCGEIFPAWKNFQLFITKEKFVFEPALIAAQQCFFSTALKEFSKMLEDKDPLQKAIMHMNAGICYKKMGDYENARTCLQEANVVYPNLAPVLAELADCYSLCGEDRIGKVLFREAFFLAPEEIDLDFLDSELIKCLISKTREKGYDGKALNCWIPVYGVLQGVFNIKRELTSQEVMRLKIDIGAMETEYRTPTCEQNILVPKLLNSYFWLVDHYILTHESTVKINEVLLKIKILDSSIFELYRN